MEHQRRNTNPMIVAVEMGYGHLRPAYALAEFFGVEVTRMDVPPIAGPVETKIWKAAQAAYNGLSRACDFPGTGLAAKFVLEKITEIAPLQNHSHIQPANLAARLGDALASTLIGRHFRATASSAGRPVIATYPAAALAAMNGPGARVFCLATDTDLNRAWAPANVEKFIIDYFAPVERVAKRLRSFGVPDQRIHVTGFPLPANLVRQAPISLSRRLYRLDPNAIFRRQASRNALALIERSESHGSIGPISITFAIGGAGAQTRQVGQILKSLKAQVLQGKLSLTLIAGIRPDVASILLKMVQSAGLANCIDKGIKILFTEDLQNYFRNFDDCLADTDILWTKPSELVFYASLGLPILLAAPVGGQEHANRNWLLSMNAGLDAGDPAVLNQRIEEMLATGELSRIAWNAYSQLERNGTALIARLIDGYRSENKDNYLLSNCAAI
jgi:hypothetical protein